MKKNNINVELAKEKELISNNDFTVYKELTKKYKYLLEYYLSTIIDFNKYEYEIKESGLFIGKNDKYKEINAYLKTDYIFLINNLFIEKLDIEDIDLLKKFSYLNISDELIEMVKKTYKEVIKDNCIDGKYRDDVYKVCYGPVVPINFVDNNALALKIYYGKNLVDILDNDEFIKLHTKQLDFFAELISKLSNEVKDKTGIQCCVLLEKSF